MWLYENKEIESIEDMPDGTYGFVYEITHNQSGRKYIGKKVLYFNRTLPPLKGKKRKRKVVKESDWKNYFGSSKEIKEIISENRQSELQREILVYATSKKLLTYYETKFLFIKGVLEKENKYINDNILGKFYRKDFL